MVKLLDPSNNLIRVIDQILGLKDSESLELMRYLKLEASWILVNISVAPHEVIEVIFKSEFKFVENLNQILKSDDV